MVNICGVRHSLMPSILGEAAGPGWAMLWQE